MITLYFALSPSLFYSVFEFMPSKFDANQYAVSDSIEHEDVLITLNNGKKIHGWYFAVPHAKNTVIVHHGQGANVAHYFPTVEVFHRIGTNVFLYDYEGFGKSDGPLTHDALRRDGEAAYFFVRNEKRIPTNQIIHCGISLGTGVACDIGARQPCKGVFLCSPYWRLSDVATRFVPVLRIYPRFAFPQPDIGAEDLVKTRVPILIVHGDNDPMISVSNAYKIEKAAIGKKDLIVIHNGNHVGGPVSGVEDFLKKWIDSIDDTL